MEPNQNQQILREATESILHVVKAFDFFRKGNAVLNNLLDNVKSVLDYQSIVGGGSTQSGNDIDIIELHAEQFHPTSILTNTKLKAMSYDARRSRSPTGRCRRVHFDDNLHYKVFQSFTVNDEATETLHAYYTDNSSSNSSRRGNNYNCDRGLDLNLGLSLDSSVHSFQNQNFQTPTSPNRNQKPHSQPPLLPPPPPPPSPPSTKREPEPEHQRKSVPPEERVFEITELLEYILSNSTLAPSDLKTCRCVSAKWNSVATSLLLQKETLQVKFEYNKLTNGSTSHRSVFNSNSNNYYSNSSASGFDASGTAGSTLEAFGEFLTISKNQKSTFTNTFPCKYFSFTAGNLTDSSLQNFFSHFGGELVKHLHIEICNFPESSTTGPSSDNGNESEFMNYFKKLLTIQLPNLEFLEIDKFPALWYDKNDVSQLFPEPRKTKSFQVQSAANTVLTFYCDLPKLKGLHFHSLPPKKIFTDLIKVSKNLESVGLGPGCDSMITWLLELKKIKLLKSLEMFLLPGPDCIGLYENLSNSVFIETLRLRKLTLNFEHYVRNDPGKWYKINQIIFKVLNACSETLEEFHTQPLGKTDAEIKLPKVMPKLRKIRLLEWKSYKYHEKLFPEQIELSKVFPALETIECKVLYYLFYYRDDSDDEDKIDLNWKKKFGASCEDIHSTVKGLHFNCGPPSTWIVNLCQMFPNLTNVRVGLIENFPAAAKSLWKLERLEKLEFWVEIGEEGVRHRWNKYPAIDEGFTGFSKTTCHKLFETSRDADLDLGGGGSAGGSLGGDFGAVVVEMPLRESPSILDAKCLRNLTVIIYDSSQSQTKSFCPSTPTKTVPCLSHVTGVFAFQLCPLLSVTIGVGADNAYNLKYLKNGLSPILPYVHAVTTDVRRPYDNTLQ